MFLTVSEYGQFQNKSQGEVEEQRGRNRFAQIFFFQSSPQNPLHEKLTPPQLAIELLPDGTNDDALELNTFV